MRDRWPPRTRAAWWQRDLSVSWNKLGEVRLRQGEVTRARAEASARTSPSPSGSPPSDPGNAGWQRDLVVSNVKLAETRAASGDGQGAAAHYRQALAVSHELAGSGRLAPTDAWMVEDLERRLTAAEGGRAEP